MNSIKNNNNNNLNNKPKLLRMYLNHSILTMKKWENESIRNENKLKSETFIK